jgi:hypothetical protein
MKYKSEGKKCDNNTHELSVDRRVLCCELSVDRRGLCCEGLSAESGYFVLFLRS